MTRQKPLFRPGWVIYLLPAVLSVVTAFVLGSVHVGPMPGADFKWSDKVGHFFAFGFVQITHARAAEFIWEPHRARAHVWGAVASASLAGGLLEIWQLFLTYRSAEWADFAADAVGAIVFGLIYLGLRGKSD